MPSSALSDPELKVLHHRSINSLIEDILCPECDAKEVSISELLGLDSPRGGFGLQDSYSGLSTPPPANDAVFQQNRGDRKGASSAWNYASVVANGRFKRNLSDGSGSAASSPTSSISSMYSTNSDSCGSSPLGTYQPWSTARAHSNSSPESEDSSAAFNTDRNIGDLLGGLTLQDAATVRGARGTEVDIFTIQQNLQTLQALRFLQQSSSPLGVSVSPTGWSYQNRYNPLLDQWTAQPSAFNSLPENVVVQLDRAAHFHRSAAAVSYANCTWNGVLPPRRSKATGYSSKVFLGGVPWDISEQTLMQTFKQFGPIHVEWPGKDKQSPQPKGYVYIIFESERHVRALLQCCTGNPSTGNFYYKISSKRMKSKQVQVIPWPINDSNCTKSTTQKLDPSRTVFVGALHGVLNAEGLSKIMNDLFDGVVYTGIDTDKYKYPIGSGRVTFNNERSYFKAVSAAFIEVQTEKFTKTIQVDPYLEDSLCSHCAVQQGPYFCRDLMCFRYFCRSCWQFRHQKVHHKPMTRNSKNSGVLNLSG